MADRTTADQIVTVARELGQAEFTRADIAKKLGVQKRELVKGFREARKSGRLEKVRDDEEGTGIFRVRGN